jgi:hypothetical protein
MSMAWGRDDTKGYLIDDNKKVHDGEQDKFERILFFSFAMSIGSTVEEVCIPPKKKLRGFPMFFTLENFLKSLNVRHKAVVESSLTSSSSLSWSSSS